MTKPLIQIDDEVREMNDDEFENYQTIVAEIDARKAEAEAKATAKEAAQAKLAELGLTVEDLTALGL
jgi:PDZ domain-containing secreted protein